MKSRAELLTVVRFVMTLRPIRAQIACTPSGSREPLMAARESSWVRNGVVSIDLWSAARSRRITPSLA